MWKCVGFCLSRGIRFVWPTSSPSNFQLSNPYSLASATGPASISTSSPSWYHVDLTTAGWPLMSDSSYYWVVVSPCSPLTLTTQASGRRYNGVLWAGLTDSVTPPSPPSDPLLYRGRQIVSERFDGDCTYGANTTAGINEISNTMEGWAGYTNQYTNWDAQGSTVRYGISLAGQQVQPPATVSSTWGDGTQCCSLVANQPLASL